MRAKTALVCVIGLMALPGMACFCGGGEGGGGDCGNGSLELGEECDDGNRDDDDGCSRECVNEGAPSCGDGILQVGEECDDGASNSDTISGACRTDCTAPVCGDGVTDPGEECDDANTVPGDGCTDCSLPGCGDGTVDAGEECDDGNRTSGDGCADDCTNEVTPACGDGIPQAGEQCDDGTANSDTQPEACRTSCQRASCGDSVTDTNEACDDGAANSDVLQGACRATGCQAAGCGDSVVDYVLGEECDDGGTAPGDGCGPSCAIEAAASCGDGNLDLDVGEQCDDGGTAAGDGCSPTCQYELIGQSCGDGTVDPDEVCDNGTAGNGDFCDIAGAPVCRCSPPCDCNLTCNLTATTSLFAGDPGNPGLADGDRLTAALFGGAGVLTATANELYVTDGANNVVRRIDLGSGVVTTIAGDAVNGNAGYVDDPDGLNARFAGMEAITTDGNTLWVADAANHVIRAIELTSGNYGVTTVAGQQYTGGTLRYSDNTDPLQAEFSGLRGLTYYAGVIYLLDGGQATLRSFDLTTGEVATIAGSPGQQGQVDDFGTAGRFISPRYMASDNSGMLYIADTNGNQIRSYNTVTTWLGTFAGSGAQGYADGVGTAAVINRPRGMTSDGTSIYWVEFNASSIRQADLATGTVTTLAGFPAPAACGGSGGYQEGTGTGALFSCPFSIVYHYPSRSLFVADGGNAVIRQIQ